MNQEELDNKILKVSFPDREITQYIYFLPYTKTRTTIDNEERPMQYRARVGCTINGSRGFLFIGMGYNEKSQLDNGKVEEITLEEWKHQIIRCCMKYMAHTFLDSYDEKEIYKFIDATKYIK